MNFNQNFDGQLTLEELAQLRKAAISKKKILKIEKFLNKFKGSITSFHDLVGDDDIPCKQFFFNSKHIGYLLERNPDKVLSRAGIQFRKMTTGRLVKILAHKFMTSKQIFEDRNDLMNHSGGKSYAQEIGLPNEPVIWAMNHHFKDDALASVRALERPAILMFGSIPLYFNTFDGVLAYLIGSILINRKSRESKKASIEKAKRALSLGADLLWCPEGVHNKTANLLTLELWNGIYQVAIEQQVKIVPVIHYIFDPTQKIVPHELNPIHTVIDDPIDLAQFSEKAGLEYLRDVFSTWYYLMMEKYGYITREKLTQVYKQRAIEHYGAKETDFTYRSITSHEIGVIYNLDLRSTVNGYDRSIEASADYRSKFIVRPEDAFEAIAKSKNPKNISNILYAANLIRERKREDYQRIF